ncbi:MAG: SH3 domain-containing protein, partial [Clostridia bacterium]|nr:SH3 domain-containing protein [Clostridia bacterium]
MKKLLSLLLILLTMSLPACAEYVTRLTPAPTQQTLPEVVLRPSDDEVKVYATPHMKAGIVGYIIVGGRQNVEVIGVQDDWYQVAFTSVYGTSRGWIPASFFMPVATPTPEPTPTPVAPQGISAFVSNASTGYRLNLRSGPSYNARSIGKYFTGTPVTMTGESMYGYAFVQIGNVSGWMDERFLTTDPYSFSSELPQVMISTTGSSGYLREGPGASYKALARYPNGTAVTVLGVRDDEWYHVAVGGKLGYMSVTVLNKTFSWQYGMDSDSPAVSGGLSG